MCRKQPLLLVRDYHQTYTTNRSIHPIPNPVAGTRQANVLELTGARLTLNQNRSDRRASGVPMMDCIAPRRVQDLSSETKGQGEAT
jgi:hypothetical protein